MMSTTFVRKHGAIFALALTLMAVGFDASANVTNANNDYFVGFYNFAVLMSTGYLGRSLALASFVLGALTGFVRGTAIPALIGFGFALLFAVGPSIITGIMGATI